MNDPIPVSVVIVSRGRPEELRRCILGVSQQVYPHFEVVVVADKAGALVLRGMPQSTHIKLVPHDEANISTARNAGIAEAAGEVVAFIDDDAVPEPSWLMFLAAPFAEPEVMAAGGFVRGRNGISFQWKAQSVDATGWSEDIRVDPGKTTILTPRADKAIKTQGTNMAFRRSWLASVGGFDPCFRYFLEDTDLNLRLARQERCTAIVPLAQVHHGFAANSHRDAHRVPRDLNEIGASWAVFLRKHCPETRRDITWHRVQRSERARALRHMQTGALEPRDVRRLMESLNRGFSEGRSRKIAPLPSLPPAASAFQPFPVPRDTQSVIVAGRSWSRASLVSRSAQAVAAGRIVTQIRLSPTALRHHVRFTNRGYWEQTGGIFGRSDRGDPAFSAYSFSRRVKREADRVKTVRLLD